MLFSLSAIFLEKEKLNPTDYFKLGFIRLEKHDFEVSNWKNPIRFFRASLQSHKTHEHSQAL